MNNRVYFIGEPKSFMVNALVDGLCREKVECEILPLTMEGIRSHLIEGEIFLLHVDETTLDNKPILNFLGSACEGCGFKLFLIGYPESISKVYSIIPKRIVWDTFEQPIGTRDLVNRLRLSSDNRSSKETKLHVLVVDDSGPTLHAVKSWLEPKYRVSIVDSAANGMTFLQTTKPDLILLDYDMPICDGPHMLSQIRADRTLTRIPVMFLTAKEDRDSVENVIALKPQGYLLKSQPPEKILESINRFFLGKRS